MRHTWGHSPAPWRYVHCAKDESEEDADENAAVAMELPNVGSSGRLDSSVKRRKIFLNAAREDLRKNLAADAVAEDFSPLDLQIYILSFTSTYN